MDSNIIFELIKTEFFALHPAEIISTVTAILYLILAARESIWCWFFGIISCAFWAWAAYFLYNLQIDSLLQIFYIVISFGGFYQWKFGGQAKEELPITQLSKAEHGIAIGSGFILTVIVGWLYANFTTAAATYLDAFTTVFSVIITFMVIHKKLENWLYWIVIDSVYVYLYWTRGGYLFSLLFVAYIVIAFLGWLKWKKKIEEANREIALNEDGILHKKRLPK